MSTDINRIAELAKEDPKRQFYSIAHLITGEKLYMRHSGVSERMPVPGSTASRTNNTRGTLKRISDVVAIVVESICSAAVGT
jgi:hypothetical protein